MTINIGFVLFPNVTQLDFTGPLQVLHRLPDSKTHIVANTREPVPSDCGLGLVPTTTFAECEPLDLVCVPGGAGNAGEVRHLRVHGRLRAGRGGPAQRQARHHALGLHGAAAHGGSDL